MAGPSGMTALRGRQWGKTGMHLLQLDALRGNRYKEIEVTESVRIESKLSKEHVRIMVMPDRTVRYCHLMRQIPAAIAGLFSLTRVQTALLDRQIESSSEYATLFVCGVKLYPHPDLVQ